MQNEKSLTPIHDFLIKNSSARKTRCYMPGHKGLENPLDITEITGADSLYDTDASAVPGIIAQSEKNASKLFGTVRTLYSCGGSTLAIQTMLALAKQKSKGRDHIIAGRYSHRSFINSCILLGLVPSWVYPEKYLGADISADEIEKNNRPYNGGIYKFNRLLRRHEQYFRNSAGVQKASYTSAG